LNTNIQPFDRKGLMGMLSFSQISKLIDRAKTIAVVGLSDRPDRPSYVVARFLQRQGYRIIPVNPKLSGPVLGEQPYKSLRDVPVHIDVVDIFRRSEFVDEIVQDAIAVGADVVWMQLGVINEAAAAVAERAGLGVVMDRCMRIEYSIRGM
jgi:predicted CoA-binding protein